MIVRSCLRPRRAGEMHPWSVCWKLFWLLCVPVSRCCACVPQDTWKHRLVRVLDGLGTAARVAVLCNLIWFLRHGAYAQVAERLAALRMVRRFLCPIFPFVCVFAPLLTLPGSTTVSTPASVALVRVLLSAAVVGACPGVFDVSCNVCRLGVAWHVHGEAVAVGITLRSKDVAAFVSTSRGSAWQACHWTRCFVAVTSKCLWLVCRAAAVNAA
jgi:hypothetical protein